jgi:hypothetical protein
MTIASEFSLFAPLPKSHSMRTIIYHHLHLSGDDGMDEQQIDWCCG